MKLTYNHTRTACYIGYITQAIINNIAPLLFVTFQREFSVSLTDISILIIINFTVQMAVDALSAKFVDKIGYRPCIVAAHLLATMGLLLMATLPTLCGAMTGLCIGVAVNAVGGGLIEVLVSPIVESLPLGNKASQMSLLHSFYCWGQVGVVLLSTAFFSLAGTEHWRVLLAFWSVVPLLNMLMFFIVPLCKPVEESERTRTAVLIKSPVFVIMLVLMLCAGASELAMSQWSSYFAETALGVSKTAGDLLGMCMFAVLMGSARVFYGLKSTKINLKAALLLSGALCIASYMLAAFSPVPLLSLAGCALCGMSVGVMWPGVFSLTAAYFPKGGTSMFALCALAGDIGCSAGPWVVGLVASLVQGGDSADSSLKSGLSVAVIFPLIMGILVFVLSRIPNNKQEKDNV